MLSDQQEKFLITQNNAAFIGGDTITANVGEIPVIELCCNLNAAVLNRTTNIHQIILTSNVNQSIFYQIISNGIFGAGTVTFFNLNSGGSISNLLTQVRAYSLAAAPINGGIGLAANIPFILNFPFPIILKTSSAGGGTAAAIGLRGSALASTLNYTFLISQT